MFGVNSIKRIVNFGKAFLVFRLLLGKNLLLKCNITNLVRDIIDLFEIYGIKIEMNKFCYNVQ